jgi:hypothetical protein
MPDRSCGNALRSASASAHFASWPAGRLDVLAPESDAWVLLPVAIDGDLGCGRRLSADPDVDPLAVLTAPPRGADAELLLGRVDSAPGDQAEAVDAGLDGPLALALDEVDLTGERVEAGALRHVHEDGEVPVARVVDPELSQTSDLLLVPEVLIRRESESGTMSVSDGYCVAGHAGIPSE